MGTTGWMLAYADTEVAGVLRAHPELDREATRAFVQRLHPRKRLSPIDDATLGSVSSPDKGTVYAAVFPGLALLLTEDAALEKPRKLHRRFVGAGKGRTLHLYATHSGTGWFAYGLWENGKLRRSLSLSAEDGVVEDIGEHLDFERPYWAGEHAEESADGDEADWADFTRFLVVEGPVRQATEPALPFNPLELGEEALRTVFGFTYEDDDPELDEIVLLGYRLS